MPLKLLFSCYFVTLMVSWGLKTNKLGIQFSFGNHISSGRFVVDNKKERDAGRRQAVDLLL